MERGLIMKNDNEFNLIESVAEPAPPLNLFGWAAPENPGLLEESFNMFKDDIKQMPILAYPARSMLWEISRKVLGKDTPNYPQEIGDPFRKGEMVLMADGSEKPIEEIKIGEMVLNHLGDPVRVNNIIKKQFTGNLVTIKIKGWHRTVTATETHHGLRLKHTPGERFKYNGEEKIKFGELQIGDYCAIPYGLNKNLSVVLDVHQLLPEAPYDDRFVQGGRKQIPRYIAVDEKFCRLLGLYLAEGGCGNSCVTWSFNHQECLLRQEVKSLVKEIFNLDTAEQKTGCENCIRVAIYGKVCVEFFKALVPGNLYSKTIPNFVFGLSHQCKMALIRGWLDGDGFKNFKVNAVIGYTSSKTLAEDMLQLMISCKLNVKSWSRFRRKRASCPNYELALYSSDCYKVYPEISPGQPVKNIQCNNLPYGVARPIENIIYTPVVDEEVYCITTEGYFTIIVNGVAIANCVSFAHKNACEYVQAYQIKDGDHDKWRSVFPPYIYGVSRVLIGGGRLGNSDGSIGTWAVQGLVKYGVLFSDVQGVPKYAGSVAKSWGRSGPPKDFVTEGSKHLVKMNLQTAKVTTWEQLKSAIGNGFPVSVCSNQGFTMQPQSDGFHHPKGAWPHCYKSGTVISGEKPKFIEDIQVGDLVYTRSGHLKKVTETFKRPYAGKIINIRAWGLPTIKMTEEHPLLVYRKDENQNGQWKATWVLAKDIKLSDYLISPTLKKNDDIQIPEWSWETKQTKNRLIPITKPDKDLAWLFGLFIADGNSVKNHKICITISDKEVLTIARACKVLVSIGMKPRVQYYKNYVRIYCDSAALARSFKEWFGGGDEEKRIPEFIYHGWDLEAFIEGLVDGDGCLSKGNIHLTSVYKKLIHQVRLILISQGKNCTLNVIDNSNRTSCYPNSKLLYTLKWKPEPSQRSKHFRVGDDYLMPIRQIDIEDYEGDVYNFEVEDDHNYIADGIVSHNCMCIIGYDTEPEEYAIILNSWGHNAHGQLVDFRTKENLPGGVLRVRKSIVESMLRADGGDSWAISDLDLGFIERLPASAFDMFKY